MAALELLHSSFPKDTGYKISKVQICEKLHTFKGLIDHNTMYALRSQETHVFNGKYI